MHFIDYLGTNWEHILELTLEHVLLVAISVGIATFVGVGLGIATYRTERPREIVLAIAATFLTIPSLALFGLFILWLGLGWVPVVIALVMYGLLPITRNTVVGLRQVDRAVVESARGMGMGPARLLLRIELPLAWPVILTGMRVSTLIMLGIGAIGAYINGPGLGNDIFDGLARIGSPFALDIVLGGTLGVVVLAVLFDLFYTLINRATTSRGIR